MFPYPKEWMSEDDEILASSIREWAEKEVIPNRQEFDEDHNNELIGPAIRKLFVDIGLQKLMWPEKYGGAGLNSPYVSTTIVRALEEVGRADPGIGFIFSGTFSLLAPIAMEPNINEDACTELAPMFCNTKDVRIGSPILPEYGDVDGINAGSIYGRVIKATAKNDGDSVTISGRKLRPLSSGGAANLFGVFCAAKGLERDDIVYVLVPADSEGIRMEEPYKKTGLVSDRNADVWFENVRVPRKYAALQRGGAECFKEVLSWHGLCASAVCIGSMMDVYEIVKEWGNTRTISGKPLKENSVDAAVLAEVANHVAVSRILTWNVARMLAKPDVYGEAWSDKMFTTARAVALHVTSSAVSAIGKAMELMASQGYATEGDVEKHWRDVKTIEVCTGKVPGMMDIARWYYDCKTL